MFSRNFGFEIRGCVQISRYRGGRAGKVSTWRKYESVKFLVVCCLYLLKLKQKVVVFSFSDGIEGFVHKWCNAEFCNLCWFKTLKSTMISFIISLTKTHRNFMPRYIQTTPLEKDYFLLCFSHTFENQNIVGSISISWK